MAFRMSPNVAVRTEGFSEAVDFYTKVLGFENRSEDAELADLDARPVLELFVDDLEKAREVLTANGCEILRWRGKGQDCYVKDPFGVIFNIWEE